MSEIKVISTNKKRNMQQVVIDGLTRHIKIDPSKPAFPKKKGVKPEEKK